MQRELEQLLLPFSLQLKISRPKKVSYKARPTKPGSKRAPRKPPVSDPELTLIWNELADRFFPESAHLHQYRIVWSGRRQKRTLASCNIERRIVRVAKEMDTARAREWIEPLLYHEMCHAELEREVPKKRGKRQWHGPEFKALERRHPKIPAFNAWIKKGGWLSSVRSHRATEYHAQKRA